MDSHLCLSHHASQQTAFSCFFRLGEGCEKVTSLVQESELNHPPAVPSTGASTGGSVDSVDSLEAGVATCHLNVTDEEKLLVGGAPGGEVDPKEGADECGGAASINFADRPFLLSILESLKVEEDDYNTLFSICLLYAISKNTGERLQVVTGNRRTVTTRSLSLCRHQRGIIGWRHDLGKE